MEVWVPNAKEEFYAGQNATKGLTVSRGECFSSASRGGKIGRRVIYPLYRGQCFSSASRGGKIGVRFAQAKEVLTHPERWRWVTVQVEGERFEIALAEAWRRVRAPYDWAGIFGFVFWPFVRQNKNKWYCSEVCCWFGYLVRAYHKRYKLISPLRAAQKLLDQGYRLKKTPRR